jgi:amino acid transporter
MSEPAGMTGLRRVLRLRDLVLFYVVAVVGMRWVAVAAAAGPSALVVWIIAAVALFIPLAFTVLELSSRYPDEGKAHPGRYVGKVVGLSLLLVVAGVGTYAVGSAKKARAKLR